MKRFSLVFIAVMAMTFLGSFTWSEQSKTIDQNSNQIQQDTFDVEAAIASIKEQIKGKENEPAETVFKNIQIMKGFPAGRILPIMQMAFNGSLGVTCDHCHVPGQWESEEKPKKQVTRDMWAMVGKINGELLKGIENLTSEQPIVNCTTCHRGDIKPATSLR